MSCSSAWGRGRKSEFAGRGAVRRGLFASILAALLLCSAAASAKIRDGNQLLQQCTATIGAQMNFCFGYLNAITDLLVENRDIDGFAACIPDGLDDPTLRDIVVAFLKENTALRRLGAPHLIARALAAAFPCR